VRQAIPPRPTERGATDENFNHFCPHDFDLDAKVQGFRRIHPRIAPLSTVFTVNQIPGAIRCRWAADAAGRRGAQAIIALGTAALPPPPTLASDPLIETGVVAAAAGGAVVAMRPRPFSSTDLHAKQNAGGVKVMASPPAVRSPRRARAASSLWWTGAAGPPRPASS
jgi:hypothetical protein